MELKEFDRVMILTNTYLFDNIKNFDSIAIAGWSEGTLKQTLLKTTNVRKGVDMSRKKQFGRKFLVSAIAASSVCAINSPPVMAQPSVTEEVVVSARKRDERLQDVPVAVSAFTEAVIEDAGINRAADFISLTPNVTFASSESAGVNFLSIRGLSQVRNGESPVAVVVDGVLMTDPGQFDQELFDIKQIELLKGPQGALYGRNAIGGAINITTQDASDELEGKVKLGGGNGGRKKVQASVSGPLADNVSFRLAGSYVDLDGLIDNTFLDKKVDPYTDQSVRARLNWRPADNMSVDFRISRSETEGGSLNFVLQEKCGEVNGCFSGDGVYIKDAADDTSTNITASRIGINERELDNVSLKVDYDWDFATFTSITAYSDQEEFYAADAWPYDCGPVCGASDLRIFNTSFGPMAMDSNQLVKVITEVETVSQEFRLTSAGDQALRWIAGVYYLSTERFRGLPTELDTGQAYNRKVFTSDTLYGFADDNDNTAYAVFGQFNYDLSDDVEVSFALRYDRDEREQTDVAPATFSANTGDTREKTFSEVQPKLTLRYQPSDDMNLFATLSKGFRSGGFNQNGVGAAAAAAGINGISDDYRKEVSSNIELGFKSTLADGRMKVNGGIFRTDVEDQHFFQFIGAINAQLINNIDEVTLQGAELDIQFKVSDALTVYAAAGLTDSEIEDYTVDPSHEGNWTPYVARTTFNTGFQYNIPINDSFAGLLRTDYERRGRQYWDTANSTDRSALHLVNLRAGLESVDGQWSVTAWSQNLTDEEYNAEYVIGGIAQIAPPRTYGLDVLVRF